MSCYCVVRSVQATDIAQLSRETRQSSAAAAHSVAFQLFRGAFLEPPLLLNLPAQFRASHRRLRRDRRPRNRDACKFQVPPGSGSGTDREACISNGGPDILKEPSSPHPMISCLPLRPSPPSARPSPSDRTYKPEATPSPDILYLQGIRIPIFFEAVSNNSFRSFG